MAEYYNANNVVVTDEAITVNGSANELSSVLRAEAYQVEDWIRNGVIFFVGCILPIASMVFWTQVLLVPQYLDDGHVYSFGPITFASVVILGVLAAAIGHFWQKPWGVVVERPNYGGFGKLTGAANKDQAEEIAAAINKAVGQE